MLSPEQDEAVLREAGFSGVSLFYAAFTWRGWVGRLMRISFINAVRAAHPSRREVPDKGGLWIAAEQGRVASSLPPLSHP